MSETTSVYVDWAEWWPVAVVRRGSGQEVDTAIVERWERAAVEFHAACMAVEEVTLLGGVAASEGYNWSHDVPEEPQ